MGLMTSRQYRELVTKPQAAKAVANLPAKVRIIRQGVSLNKTEAAYAAHLENLRRGGEVAWFAAQAITLRLADDTRYTPDFVVVFPGGRIEFHEVKGFLRDDALAKFKIAAGMYPWARFVMVRWEKRSRWVVMFETERKPVGNS